MTTSMSQGNNGNKAKRWAELAQKSGGTMRPVPIVLSEATTRAVALYHEAVKRAQEFDKASAQYQLDLKQYWHEVRQALEKEGMTDIWSKDISWNQDALKDGMHILNIRNSNVAGGMPL